MVVILDKKLRKDTAKTMDAISEGKQKTLKQVKDEINARYAETDAEEAAAEAAAIRAEEERAEAERNHCEEEPI